MSFTDFELFSVRRHIINCTFLNSPKFVNYNSDEFFVPQGWALKHYMVLQPKFIMCDLVRNYIMFVIYDVL